MKLICISFSQGSGFDFPSMRRHADCMVSVSGGDVLPLNSAHPNTIHYQNKFHYYNFFDELTKNGCVPEINNAVHECNNDFYTTSREVMNQLYPGSSKFVGNYKYFIVNSDVDIGLIFSKIAEKLRRKGYHFAEKGIQPNTYISDKVGDAPLSGEKRIGFERWADQGAKLTPLQAADDNQVERPRLG